MTNSQPTVNEILSAELARQLDDLRSILNQLDPAIEAPRLLTTEQLADRLQVNEERIHTMVKAGMPVLTGLGKGFRFSWPDVLAYVNLRHRREEDWRQTA